MQTVKLIAKNKATKKDGTTPIYIQYSYNREKRTLLNTNKSIEPKYWNYNTSKIRRNYKDEKNLNDHIDTLRKRVESIVDEAIINKIDPTLQYVRSKYESEVIFEGPEPGKDFFSQLDYFIENSKSRVSVDVIKDYNSLKKHLTNFKKNTRYDLTFKTINYDFYQKFRKYLIYDVEKPNGEKGLATNTVGKQFKNLKVFIRDCIKRGITSYIDLSDLKTETEEVDSIYLNEAEINKIWELNLSKNPDLLKSRDLFIIGCETGLRFSDYSKLRFAHIKGSFIRKRTEKVHKNVVIPVSNLLQKVLDKYDNHPPNNISLKDFNINVKEIGKLAKIDEDIIMVRKRGNKKEEQCFKKYELISSHTCRRSFCTNQFYKGMPTLLIRKISGHRTESAFLNYIKVDEEAAAQKMLKLWQDTT